MVNQIEDQEDIVLLKDKGYIAFLVP